MVSADQSGRKTRFYVLGEMPQVVSAISDLYGRRMITFQSTTPVEETSVRIPDIDEPRDLRTTSKLKSIMALCPPSKSRLQRAIMYLAGLVTEPQVYLTTYFDKNGVVEVVADDSPSCPIRPESMSRLGLKLVSYD